MKVLLVVHGAVQGVGYRWLVKKTAHKYGVKGMVRNLDDGSVEILAEGDQESIGNFKAEINVNFSNGPQVFRIEEYGQNDERFPKGLSYNKFEIED